MNENATLSAGKNYARERKVHLLQPYEEQILKQIRALYRDAGEPPEVIEEILKSNFAELILVLAPRIQAIPADTSLLLKDINRHIMFSDKWRQGEVNEYHHELVQFLDNLEHILKGLQLMEKSGWFKLLTPLALQVHKKPA